MPVDVGEHGVERLRLGEVPRKAVEDEATASVRLVQPLPDQLHRQIVRHELPRGKDRLDPPAELRPRIDRVAKHLPGGDVRDAVIGREPDGLGAFARPLRPEEQEVHG